MVSKVIYSKNQLRDYSSIFLRNEVISWFKGNFNSLDVKINRYSDNIPKASKTNYLTFIKHAYSVLEKNYQNEYLLKNTFLTKWLIDEIGETDSKVFSEFRVGESIVDLAMFNGTSKAFEIKTQYDSDTRLEGQIRDYKKIFNQVYLIIPDSKLAVYEKFRQDVGIILFNSNSNVPFRIFCKPVFEKELNPNSIMEVLHTEEYKKIVMNYYGELPRMTSFNQYNICSDLIKSIPKERLNKLYISTIKKRNDSISLYSRNHTELNQISLALKLKKNERNVLINNLKTPINY